MGGSEGTALAGARVRWDSHWSAAPRNTHAATLSDSIKYEYLSRSLEPLRGSVVLEVGCGSGTLSLLIARDGFRVASLDISPAALKLARKRAEEQRLSAHYIVGDGFALPFRDEEFGIIVSTGLLEHFPDPLPVIREMVRVLRPGGLFCSDVVPAGPSLYRLFNYWRPLRVGGHALFEGRFTAAQLHAWLSETQLEKVTVRRVGVLPPAGLINRVAPFRVLSYRLRNLWIRLDSTWLAQVLGYYYFAIGWKPLSHQSTSAAS